MLAHLNLAGDGDEVDAVEAVERAFGVRLDVSDAPVWVTVGDLFASLKRALPREFREDAWTWSRFCQALCSESGDDPARVTAATRLLLP